ncbi:MAG: phosphatidylserine decarboxylase family protein [Spirosomaceae bacterium]|jgi:phosphatidylserine decarboxylase|nr:phosphatidylserine decarboxylase family protein [Spirosomataceae bacterium]
MYSIHREGGVSIALSIIFFGLMYFIATFFKDSILYYLFIGTGLFIFLVILQFFRVPVRQTTINPNHIIAPADGKVVAIEEVVETEYFKGPRRQVSIFMSPINVHINFNPLSGIVSYFKYHPGKYLYAWDPKSSTDNERTTVVVKHDNGTEVLFRQIAGALARRICWYVNEGDKVTQGKEFGFIKFGSRVDVFLPLDAKVLVKIGDKPVGGETVIATLN